MQGGKAPSLHQGFFRQKKLATFSDGEYLNFGERIVDLVAGMRKNNNGLK